MVMKIPKDVSALFIIGLTLFIGFIIPITLVLGNQEISNPDILFRLNLFSTLLIIGSIGTGAVYFGRKLWKGDNKYGDSFGFFNIGEKVKFFKRFTATQLTLYSLIGFPILFLISRSLNVGGFTGSFVLPQQFSPGESLVFSSLLIPIAEEYMSIFVTGILVLALIFIAIRFKMSKDDFNTWYFGLIPILIGFFAIIWHGSAYPGSDVGLTIVFIFWWVKTIILLATGLILVAIIMHIGNNFFLDFGRLFSNNVVFGFTIGIILLLVLIASVVYKGRILGDKSRK